MLVDAHQMGIEMQMGRPQALMLQRTCQRFQRTKDTTERSHIRSEAILTGRSTIVSIAMGTIRASSQAQEPAQDNAHPDLESFYHS
jgi:hypothetical protein